MTRNWKWFVPVAVLVSVAIFAAFVASLLALMRTSGAYQGAVARTQADVQVVAALGTPVRDGFLFTGNINVNNAHGRAEFLIPLHGPKGEAMVHVQASKTAGTWHFDRLIVHLAPPGDPIDLSEKSSVPAPEKAHPDARRSL